MCESLYISGQCILFISRNYWPHIKYGPHIEYLNRLVFWIRSDFTMKIMPVILNIYLLVSRKPSIQ